MSKLSKSQILSLQRQLIEQSGGIDGIRDEGLLDAALAAHFQSFNGQDVYITIQQKAARLGCFLQVKNGKSCTVFLENVASPFWRILQAVR